VFQKHRFLDQTPLPASKQVSQLNATCGALLVVASGRISRECLLLGQFFCTQLRYNSDHEPAPWVLLDNPEFFFCQTRVSGRLPGTTEAEDTRRAWSADLFSPKPNFGQTALTGRMFDRIFCSMRGS